GVVDDASTPITINLQLEDDSLSFDVSNRINKSQKDQTTGIGLPNIRRRLELIYPCKYNLEVHEDGQ
ncbi:MAG: histidine kinase, partial [Pontibacter sp.]|nr:histidine kinase [Pontibacter sp.]